MVPYATISTFIQSDPAIEQQTEPIKKALPVYSERPPARQSTVIGSRNKLRASYWIAEAEKLPSVLWLRASRSRQVIVADLVAGATVAVMAVPQAVSFAAMAGLPAAYGLYTAFVPVLVYCLFGSSRHLALGPVALVSLLLSDGLVQAIPGSDVNTNPNQPANPRLQAEYNRAAIQVSGMVAVLYLIMGIFRLGFLLDLLSKPIISAFLSAGALIISFSQVKYIMGYSTPHASRLQDILYHLIARRHLFAWPACVLGLLWICILVAAKNAPALNSRLSWVAPLGPMMVAVLSIAAVWRFDLADRLQLDIAGRIQAGLPPLTVEQWWPLDRHWPQLAKTALLIGAVSILEAISIAKALAERHGDKISPDRELVAMGMCNLAGAAFCSYPATGSFARSAMQSSSGAKTGVAGLWNALLIGAVLYCLTPVAQYLPLNALAAIVIVGVVNVMDFGHLLYLARISKRDCAVWLITFFGCLTISIDLGLAMGVVTSLLLLVHRIACPAVSVLAQLPQSVAYRPVGMYDLQEKAYRDRQICIVKVQGPLCFANVHHIEKRLQDVQISFSQPGAVVLDCSAITFVDSSGLKLLVHLLLTPQHNVTFLLADPSISLLRMLRRSKIVAQLGAFRL